MIGHRRVQPCRSRDVNCRGDQGSADALPTLIDMQPEDLALRASHHVGEHTQQAAVMLVGAQPSARVEEFLDALVPFEPDALVEAGDETALRTALELEPGRADSAVALAASCTGAVTTRRRSRCSATSPGPSRPTAWPPGSRLEDEPDLRDASPP